MLTETSSDSLRSYFVDLKMSEPPEEQRDFEEYYTVFRGSSPEDVSHARQLWSSVSLLPPLEYRLVSADIRQRLPVSRPGPRHSAPDPPPPSVPNARQRREERRRYEAMAERRRETAARLRALRERRIRKELISAGFKPKLDHRENTTRPQPRPAESETDEELVKQLQ